MHAWAVVAFISASAKAGTGHDPDLTWLSSCQQKERPEGIIVQFGGQTPLSLAKPLQDALEKNPILAASGEPKRWHTSPRPSQFQLDITLGFSKPTWVETNPTCRCC